MYKKIVINVADHETRVALLEDGNIAELFIEQGDASDIAGNIYKGKVQRVLPGMQAAFVDIGLKQAAFIYVNDIIGENYSPIEDFLNNNSSEEEEGSYNSYISSIRRDRHIEDICAKGEENPYRNRSL